VTAAIVAMAVFLAAGVFAWTAFDGAESPPPGPAAPEIVAPGQEGSILWPERSIEALERAADGTGAIDAWRFNPLTTARMFAEQVLGWYPDRSYDLTTYQLADGFIRLKLTRVPEKCTVDEDRGFAPCLAASEEITLVQPLRGSEIWAISDVRSPSLTIDATSGQVVTNGESIDVGASVDPTLRVVVGADIGGDEACYGNSGEARLDDATGSIEVAIAPDRETGSGCGERAPGYLFAASVTWRATAGVDPLVGDSSQYVAVTAVPIAVDILENAPPEGTTTYTDIDGWQADVPDTWSAAPLIHEDSGEPAGGAVFSYSRAAGQPEPPPPTGSQSPSPSGELGSSSSELEAPAMPPGEITMLIQPDLGHDPEDDSRFPVTLEELGCDLAASAGCSVSFVGNTVRYTLAIRHGADVPAERIAEAEAIVTSIRFPSLEPRYPRLQLIALGPSDGYPEGKGTSAWADARFGVVYVMSGPMGTYALDVPDSCGEGQNQTWDAETLEILIECPDGSDIRYDRFGTPNPLNDPAYRAPISGYDTVITWIGTLVMLPSPLPSGYLERLWP
jgi:hypothetical protein